MASFPVDRAQQALADTASHLSDVSIRPATHETMPIAGGKTIDLSTPAQGVLTFNGMDAHQQDLTLRIIQGLYPDVSAAGSMNGAPLQVYVSFPGAPMNAEQLRVDLTTRLSQLTPEAAAQSIDTHDGLSTAIGTTMMNDGYMPPPPPRKRGPRTI